jgi:hypothetical protein
MKQLVRKAIELLKSKNTILCESIIAAARKDEINFKTDGIYKPLNFKFKNRDVDIIDQDVTIRVLAYDDLSYAVIIDCNIYIHKYLPLINSDDKNVDVHVDFASNQISLIDSDANEYFVKVSSKMRKLLEKAIVKTIKIK